jgi:hypothetical protein
LERNLRDKSLSLDKINRIKQPLPNILRQILYPFKIVVGFNIRRLKDFIIEGKKE